MATKKKKKQDMKTLAKLGGKATLAKYGKSHYQKMIETRWKNEKKKKEVAVSKK